MAFLRAFRLRGVYLLKNILDAFGHGFTRSGGVWEIYCRVGDII